MLSREYLRLFVENHEAQQIPEVRGPEGLPLQHDHIRGRLDRRELQQLGLTYDTQQGGDGEHVVPPFDAK